MYISSSLPRVGPFVYLKKKNSFFCEHSKASYRPEHCVERQTEQRTEYQTGHGHVH